MNRRELIIGSTVLLSSNVFGQSKDFADTALVLSTDVSGSIDMNEYQLQKVGIAKAFTSPMMEKKLQSTSVAVIYHEWNSRSQFGDWFLIHNIKDAHDFVNHVMNFERAGHGGTGVADAIEKAVATIMTCPYEIGRRVIDISGDGKENLLGDINKAKLLAKSLNIQINGLPILNNEEPDLLDWYKENVIVGQGSFCIPADGFEDFENAMKRKLLGEIS
jgi:hypothetical protein